MNRLENLWIANFLVKQKLEVKPKGKQKTLIKRPKLIESLTCEENKS
jgi:hypothetical protein